MLPTRVNEDLRAKQRKEVQRVMGCENPFTEMTLLHGGAPPVGMSELDFARLVIEALSKQEMR